MIKEWRESDYLIIDGYRSTSLKESVALNFASNAESDELDPVILKIRFENETSKYYICLDIPDYTMYTDEQEILLQAGLKAKVESYEIVNDNYGERTIINLYISDQMVVKEKRKRTLDFAIPLIIYGIN